MNRKLYRSVDDGSFYDEVEDPTDAEHWDVYEIPDRIEFTFDVMAEHAGDLRSILVATNQLVKVEP